jgi:hypothetical protein
MKRLLLVALMGLFAFAAYAADVTGKWTAQLPGRGMRGGTATVENTFVFKVDGKKLTGTVNMGRGGDSEIHDGKVEGDQISFTIVSSFGGADVSFKGKVSGDSIAFSRTMEGEDFGTPPTTFTATRAK